MTEQIRKRLLPGSGETDCSRYIQTVIMMGFFVFFQDLCEFVIHCNKRHVCLFFLLTITGRNEAIIVELKK